jgi:hypothetical protein
MYSYSKNDDRPRCWRPDLTNLMLRWMSTVPDYEWGAHFVSFGVGLHGEFMCCFQRRPTSGGPSRRVTVILDHDVYGVHCENEVWKATDGGVMPYNADHMQKIVDHAVTGAFAGPADTTSEPDVEPIYYPEPDPDSDPEK